ncbi:ARHGAP44 [Acanthosepion pharaonis]|uniref:ARHGAP44 n=1 Tax=Acanthosepion pharaonis TaxID=158019 RepID=A0A812E600_ACAPH|nr:ARHGAP44 [Sepia pharaonis]
MFLFLLQKKLPETGVGHTMLESASTLGTDSILGAVFHMCGECQNGQAKELLNYELEVENTVLNPMNLILENDIPTIMKLRKNLNKLTLDMDSARNRWTTAVRQSQMNSTNMAAASYKADIIRGEFEDASNKVDNAKDMLATEMLNFIAKENDHCEKLVALMTAQANYHKNALETIDRVIPKVKQLIDSNPAKPVYGVPLKEHLRVTERTVALVIEACVCTLLDAGLEEEGLFRIAGMASKVKKLKASFDAGIVDMEEYVNDLHTVAGALKQYLRELPEPLLTFELYKEFMQSMQLPQEQRLAALAASINKLPKVNYDNFRYLVKFLAKLASHSDVNKMTASNIAIVIGPNLLWSPGDSAPNMLTTGNFSAIIEVIINNADYFFPGDIDFHLTMNSSAACAATSPPAPSPVASAHNQISDLPSPQSSHKQSLSGQIPPSQKKSASEPEATSPAAGSSLSLATSVIPLLKLTTDDSNLNLHQSSTDIASALSSGSSTLTGSSLPEKLNMLDDSGQSDRPIQEIDFSATFVESTEASSSSGGSVQEDVMSTSFAGSASVPAAVTTIVTPSITLAQPQLASANSTSHTLPAIGSSHTQPNFQVSYTPEFYKKSQNLSASCISVNLPTESDSSPKSQRKPIPAKKPAPPPPPERPHSVAVSPLTQSKMTTSMTWPRQANTAGGQQTENTLSTTAGGAPPPHPPPPAVVTSNGHGTLERDKSKVQSSPTERKASESKRPQPPERPKGPPPIAPGSGHHRSASTGSFGVPTSASQPPENKTEAPKTP